MTALQLVDPSKTPPRHSTLNRQDIKNPADWRLRGFLFLSATLHAAHESLCAYINSEVKPCVEITFRSFQHLLHHYQQLQFPMTGQDRQKTSL